MKQYYQDNLGGWHELPDASFAYLLTQNFPNLTFTAKTQADYDAAHALTLQQAQTNQLAILNAACSAQIYAGFTSSALGTVHTYPAKDKDQVNLSASVTASLIPSLPANWTTPFWCMDSSGMWAFVPHNAAQIQQAGTDGKAAIVTALQKNSTLAAQVMAATTVSAVQAIVW